MKLTEKDKLLWEKEIEDVYPIENDKYVNVNTNKNICIHEKQDLTSKRNKNPIIVKEIGQGSIEKKISRKLKKGCFEIDVEIDLHGKTLNQAFNLFIETINDYSHMKNFLVITGKSGKIKEEFLDWCLNINVKNKIFYVCPAHKKHGGEGAWYVILSFNN